MTAIVQRKRFKTAEGHKIPHPSVMVDILEVSIAATGFVAVTLPAATFCKKVIVTARDGASWLISEAGTSYATIPAAYVLHMDIVGDPAQVLFYAKGTSTTVLEVICLD